jgi:hypothetical protein
MDTEQFEERCISYLYNEMNDEERLKFQHLIASDRESNLKFNSIRRAQAILARIPKIDPPGAVNTAGIRAEKGTPTVATGAKSKADIDSDPATDADTDADARTYRKQGTTSRTAATASAGTPSAGSKPASEAKKGNSGDSREPGYPRLRILAGGPWSRAVSAAAAVLFGLLIFGAVSGLQVRWDSDGFAMSMSLFGESGSIDNTPPAPTYLLQDETLEQLRKQQEELFSEIMAAEREQQRIMLLETLSEYAEAIETRRMIDMQLIGHELADFQQQTNQQLSQTDRIIYQLIETLSYNQELQDEQQ